MRLRVQSPEVHVLDTCLYPGFGADPADREEASQVGTAVAATVFAERDTVGPLTVCVTHIELRAAATRDLTADALYI